MRAGAAKRARMIFPRPVCAVIFDMDGLLVDTEAPVRDALMSAAAAIGRDLPAPVFMSMVGTTSAHSDRVLVELNDVAAATTADGAIQLKNRTGFYFPVAPPPGFVHHYEFDLYALDTKLPLDVNATRDDVEKALAGHIIGKAVIVEKFKR